MEGSRILCPRNYTYFHTSKSFMSWGCPIIPTKLWCVSVLHRSEEERAEDRHDGDRDPVPLRGRAP